MRKPEPEIDGREYKLLLDPDEFRGAPDKAAAKLWNRLVRLIDKHLDGRDGDGSRARGSLALDKERIVTFVDSKKKHVLDENDFALRSRTTFEGGRPEDKPEITLKFRSSDLLLAEEYCRAAKSEPGKTAFEEDIAPLQVSRGKKGVVVPDPPSTYSRFAVSTERRLNGSFETLDHVFAKFAMARETLRRNAGNGADGGVRLVTGPTILELVFGDAKVDLGGAIEAEFAFTLWYFLEGHAKSYPWEQAKAGKLAATVAEISFDFKIEDGRMDADAAERALKLFVAMQEKLPVNREGTSKTKLGLP